MTTYHVVSDIHANYAILHQKTKNLPSESLIFLGDYVDGFFLEENATIKTLNYVKNRVSEGSKAILGNHDKMLLDFLNAKNPVDFSKAKKWLFFNGGLRTLKNLLNKDQDHTLFSEYGFNLDQEIKAAQETLLENEQIKELMDFLSSLPYNYHKNLLPHVSFVHAGYELGKPYLDQDEDSQLWIRNTFYERKRNIHNDFKNTLIVAGHTPTPTIHHSLNHKPYYRHLQTPNTGILVIDAGSNGSRRTPNYNLNVVTIEHNDLNQYHIKCDNFNHTFQGRESES